MAKISASEVDVAFRSSSARTIISPDVTFPAFADFGLMLMLRDLAVLGREPTTVYEPQRLLTPRSIVISCLNLVPPPSTVTTASIR